MKSAIILMSVLFVAVTCGRGIPTRKCPAGEHSVLYCPQKAEPSCDNPTVHELPTNNPNGGLCGVPQCFCNSPNVRDTKIGKCVPVAKCEV